MTFDEWRKHHAYEFSRLDLYAESLIRQAWEAAQDSMLQELTEMTTTNEPQDD